MTDFVKTFKQKSAEKSADKLHYRKLYNNISKYEASLPKGKGQFVDLMAAREKAKNVKWYALENLHKLLEEYERNAQNSGVTVIWAEDAAQAQKEILKICQAKKCRTLVKSKSMVTEEIHLNDYLGKHKIDCIETDLGEYIQQMDGEAPYHILTPAMHKSKEDVAQLFSQHLGTNPEAKPNELTQIAREKLRTKYTSAEVGITGANFLLADVGGIALTENEGNGRLTCGFPKTHIVVAGIERMLPSINDLTLFWPLLSTYGTGQKITAYSSIITGPKKETEVDGPEEMYVVLLDNGRTNILANPEMRQSLYCIRCGACLNACPIYKNIGGHAYGTTYTGPIGSVISPNLRSLEDFNYMSYSSSLCGACTEVCAVRIDLHELLLKNRNETVKHGYASPTEGMVWKVWKSAMLHRSWMNMGGGKMKSFFINRFGKSWTKRRSKLKFPAKTFNQMWKEKNKAK